MKLHHFSYFFPEFVLYEQKFFKLHQTAIDSHIHTLCNKQDKEMNHENS